MLQKNTVFFGTILDNLGRGNPDATDEECISAAKLANADGFIRRLPDGYNTMLTCDGANLSQGQRRPLAILHPCRIFLKIGLFSGLYKPEVNEYIAFKSKARPEDFSKQKSTSRAITAFYSLFRAITLPSGNAQEAERLSPSPEYVYPNIPPRFRMCFEGKC